MLDLIAFRFEPGRSTPFMLNVYYSNRMDALIEPLIAHVRARDARDPLETFSIVVPNRATGAWLRLAIADRTGLASNLEFPFLNAHLRRIAEQARVDDRRIGILTQERLALLFFHDLSTIDAQSAPELTEPNRWINHAPTDASRTARRWEMARKLGEIFHEYAFNRSELLRDWAKQQPPRDARWTETRHWQHALWRRIVSSKDRAFGWTLSADARETLSGRRLSEESLARTWTSLPEVILPAMASSGGRSADALRELHVFATNQPGTTLLRALHQLSARSDVHFYVLNPCAEFWEDVRDTSLSELMTSAQLPTAATLAGRLRSDDLAIESDDDPYGLFKAKDPELLRLWGRTGREFVMLLTQLSDGDFEGRFRAPRIPEARTLLERMQQDVLLRAEQPIVGVDTPEEPEGPGSAADSDSHERFDGDASIRFFAAPTVLRELEYVAEDIEARLAADETLKPTDIAVMIAGTFEPYFALSERAFATFGMFPVEYLDAPLSSRSRVSVAAQQIFELLQTDFKRHEVVATLGEILSVQGRKEQLERWEIWIDEADVVFGVDHEDLESTYLDPSRYHWSQGLTRVALGSFVEEQKLWSPSPDKAPLRATSRAGDELQPATELTRYVRALIGDKRFARGRYRLSEWADAFVRMLRFYLRPIDPVDERSLERVIQAVQNLADLDPVEGPVPASVALSLALEGLRGVQARSAVRMIDGVRFGPLDQLGGIPHRHTYVLGLNDGEFPRREVMSTLDLRREKRRKGDVRREERDRYRFLNVLMNAEDSLTCSYHAVDPVSGEAMEPSSVVHELQHAMRAHVSQAHVRDVLTVEVSSGSVPRDSASAAHSASGIRTSELAKRLRAAWRADLEAAERADDAIYALPQNFVETQRVLPAKTWRGLRQITRAPAVPDPVERPLELDIDLRAIARFFDRPTETIIAQRMGFSTGVWLDDSSEETTEPFALDERTLATVVPQVLIDAEPGTDADALIARVAGTLDSLGAMPSAPFTEQALARIAGQVSDWTRAARILAEEDQLGGARSPREFARICIGSGHAEVDYAAVLPPLRFSEIIADEDGAIGGRCVVTGHVDAISETGSLLTFIPTKLGRPKTSAAVKDRNIRTMLLTWMLCRAVGVSPDDSRIVFVPSDINERTTSGTLSNQQLSPLPMPIDEIRRWFMNYIKHAYRPSNHWLSGKGLLAYATDLHQANADLEAARVERARPDAEPVGDDALQALMPSREALYAAYLAASDAEIADRLDPPAFGTKGRRPDLSFEAHRLPPAPEPVVRALVEELYLPLMQRIEEAP